MRPYTVLLSALVFGFLIGSGVEASIDLIILLVAVSAVYGAVLLSDIAHLLEERRVTERRSPASQH